MAGNIKLNWICTSPTTIFSRVLPTLYRNLKQRIMVLAVIFLFFLIRKKEDYTLHFQSLSTFKKVPKNINNWVIDYHEKKKPKLLTNLHKKSFLFRITQSILFHFKLKHSIKFIFVFFLYWTRWLDWTRRCMYGSLCTLTGGGVLCLFPIIDLCDHSL